MQGFTTSKKQHFRELDAAEEPAELAKQILGLLFNHRRLLSNEVDSQDEIKWSKYDYHLKKILAFINAESTIHLVLPAFPAKSSNPDKTLGPLPDMGELLSIQFLAELCNKIKNIYHPGAKITICSDGRVFSDLVKVKDTDVSAYSAQLGKLIDEKGDNFIDQYSLDDEFTATNFDTMREELLIGHAKSLTEVRENCLNNDEAKNMFNGIHRFVFEDEQVLNPSLSKNKVKEYSKNLAYRVIQRSNAWSNLVAERFPDSLRLSIHPQADVSEKLGIKLLDIDNPWITPWHSVVLDDGKSFRLVKRAEAEKLNSWLIYREGSPSHYVLPNTRPQELQQ